MKAPSAAGFELDSDAHITPVLRSMMENATNNIGKAIPIRFPVSRCPPTYARV